jgi:flagellin-like hook-associated protein FlgL
VNPSDDAGGLAVSMKMSAAQKRTEATAINLRNIRSYLEVQDGAFQVADRVLNRMSELSTLARDVTKNSGDVENYDKEFQNLQLQLISLGTERFNGIQLFREGSADVIHLDNETFDVPTSEDGKQLMSATQANLTQDPFMSMMIYGFAQVGSDSSPVFVPAKSSGPITSGFDHNNGETVALTLTQAIESNLIFGHTSTPFTLHGTTSPSYSFVASTGAGGGFNVIETTVSTSGTTTTASVGSYTTAQIDALKSNSENNSANADASLLYRNSDEFVKVVQMALQNLADMRAQNGSEMSRVNFAEDLLKINAINLEAANSRIIDVDVAAESSQLARYQILQQAGTAMLAQANTSQQSLVRLLQG